MRDDPFRPRRQPAQTIYDAFQEEARKRKDGRSFEEWSEAERMAVWKAASEYAQAHGMTVPTMEQVKSAERYAMGSIDYGAKWAYQVERCMVAPKPAGSSLKVG